MQKKENKQLTKIQLEKKKEKGLLWCKILTAVSLGLSLLSLLFSCSANVNKADQTNKNDNVTILNRHNAYEGDSFIYNGDYGYIMKSNFSAYEINDFISYIDVYLGDNKDKSIYFIFDNGETHSIYNVVSIDNNNDLGSFTASYIYNDGGNIVYPQFTFDTRDYELGDYDIILKFNKFYQYSDLLSQYFDRLVNLYNYTNNTTSFYYTDYELGLLGSYTLTNSYNKQTLYLKGNVYYYDSYLNYVSFSFNQCIIDYDSGLQFFNDNESLQLYTGLQGVNQRAYTLRHYDIDNDQLVKVSNVILSQTNLDYLPSYFIPLNVRYQQAYNLANMYYSQRMYVSSTSTQRIYNFNYRSNNRSFNQFKMIYTYNQSPIFYWNYRISYGSNNNYTLVLDVDATVDVNGTVGNAQGVDYTFNLKIEGYQTFTIYDFFSTEIQYFQINEGYPVTLKNDNSIISGNNDLGTALDVIVGVFTSFLPFLSFEIFPSVTIGVLLLIPFFITLMIFIFNMFKR